MLQPPSCPRTDCGIALTFWSPGGQTFSPALDQSSATFFADLATPETFAFSCRPGLVYTSCHTVSMVGCSWSWPTSNCLSSPRTCRRIAKSGANRSGDEERCGIWTQLRMLEATTLLSLDGCTDAFIQRQTHPAQLLHQSNLTDFADLRDADFPSFSCKAAHSHLQSCPFNG